MTTAATTATTIVIVIAIVIADVIADADKLLYKYSSLNIVVRQLSDLPHGLSSLRGRSFGPSGRAGPGGSGAISEEALHCFTLVTRHPQFLSAVQLYDMAALEPWPDLANAAHIDNAGPVNPDKVSRIELLHQGLHGFPDFVDLARGVQQA
jgi:hypothetical protein